MDKRVLIFAPYVEYQRKIEFVVEDYFKKNFHEIDEINIQKFSSIGDSINRGNKIGLGGEVLVIFDRKLCSKNRDLERPKWTNNKRFEFNGEILWDTSKPDGMLRKCMDVSRMKELGFGPTISLEAGIKEMIHIYNNIKTIA